MMGEIDNEPFLGISLWQMTMIYLKLAFVVLLLLGTHQEVMTKGTFINRQIRHYFGLQHYVEYTAEATKQGGPIDI